MNFWVIWSRMGILTLDAAAAEAQAADVCLGGRLAAQLVARQVAERSEEHTSELQSQR